MVNWLITGISGGLGQELAQAALARGDKVFGTSRSVEACAQFAALAPGRSFAHGLDFADASAPAAVTALAEQTMGGIYGASKYALECVGQTLAQEVRPLGIKVTNVAPGGMRTNFAGGSLRLAERTLADYAGTAHFARHSLTTGLGQEKGDPARAASAILAALDESEPPMHLLLGEDALHYAEGQTDLLRAEMERWRHYSLSTAYPAVEAVGGDA